MALRCSTLSCRNVRFVVFCGGLWLVFIYALQSAGDAGNTDHGRVLATPNRSVSPIAWYIVAPVAAGPPSRFLCRCNVFAAIPAGLGDAR
jgi:hypothetical protein